MSALQAGAIYRGSAVGPDTERELWSTGIGGYGPGGGSMSAAGGSDDPGPVCRCQMPAELCMMHGKLG